MTYRAPSGVEDCRLCVIVDAGRLRGRSPSAVAAAAIEGGAGMIQLRDKTATGRVFCENALAVRRVCREAGVLFIVNDRVDVAVAADADGAHVGQDDLPADAARRLLGPDRVMGVSAKSAAEARRAESDGADYVGAGPVFEARETKPDAAAPIGPAGLGGICRATRLPVIAIGGINAGNAKSVFEAGASGMAVISAVLDAGEVREAVAGLMAAGLARGL